MKIRERNVCKFSLCGLFQVDSPHIYVTGLLFITYSCKARLSLHLQKLFQAHVIFFSNSIHRKEGLGHWGLYLSSPRCSTYVREQPDSFLCYPPVFEEESFAAS